MSEKTSSRSVRGLLTVFVVAGVSAAIGAFIVAAVLVSVFEHKAEEKNPFYRVVDLDDETTDPAVWGKNFPLQYDDYMKTVDMTRTRYGGSEAMPRVPDKDDWRGVVSQSKINEDPRLKTMWAGYAFSHDFREERGHAYMLEDQTLTKRHEFSAQAGTCVHCHASVYAPYKKLGDGDLIKGFEKMNQMPYSEARTHVDHPVACIDCHDPQSMELRVTRPGFIEGIRTLKASQGVEDYDVNRDATRAEMRTYACAQCHVEYYFKGKEKRLTYPWANGLRADEILAYYEEIGFKDWVHEETGAPVLKAQHPEFEMWAQGIHARNGVSCADCHMPYKRVGAMKISDHHVRSPLLNINNACQTCHKVSEEELLDRAETIQERHFELRDIALDALVELIHAVKEAKEDGITDEELADAMLMQKRAQFLLDFVEAENSTGFHADQESARVLGKSIDYARQGHISITEQLRQKMKSQPAGG